MIKPVYINGIGSVSIQPTFEKAYFFDGINTYSQNPIPAYDPDYKLFIPALQLRRMNKSMKMALFASQLALRDAAIQQVDAIITGTGLGCLKDSERFVETMLQNKEQFLNPTPFIQSTHNMAAASIALALGCRGYNMTYVNNSNSFESAVLDTMLYLQEHPQETVLLGGVDELGERTTQFWEIAGYLKHEKPAIPTALPTATPGEIAAEGASFFVAAHQPNENTYGKIAALETRYEVADATAFIVDFLEDNHVALAEIDAVVLGNNGDVNHDGSYQNLSNLLFAETAQIGYKHVLGEYDTVVAAAIGLVALLLKQQRIPEALKINNVNPTALKRILVYNQRRGKNHSLMLMER